MSTQLQAVGLRMQTLRSSQQMAEAMRGASRSLASMNRSMNIMAVQRILQEFERESSAMDMKNDIMNDTIEDAIGTEDDALGDNIGENEESEAILRQVLDEIGVDISQQLRNVPENQISANAVDNTSKVAISEAATDFMGNEDMALQERLDRLRKAG
ncbi:ESCRT-III subunit protein did4 [Malassezia nana]|uniref:ESCRT-III subunit protein did4 n=1 Tax=Malassezia nana TaxID=180528 RepID=A0AAF0ESU6_9BASI|nr:ESCRT-III subunit protein did4 [Malassezia nana]